MLAALQGRLPPNPFLPVTGWLNAELWGDWSAAEGHSVQGVADLADARLVNDYQDLWLDRVNTRFRWHFHNKKHWDLHLADFLYDGDGEQPWTAPRISMARNTAAGLGLWISADWLPLGVPLRLTRDVMSIYGTPWPAFLPGSADGTVSEFDLVLDAAWGIELARGEVQGGGVADWGRWPDLQGLEGQVALGRNTRSAGFARRRRADPLARHVSRTGVGDRAGLHCRFRLGAALAGRGCRLFAGERGPGGSWRSRDQRQRGQALD